MLFDKAPRKFVPKATQGTTNLTTTVDSQATCALHAGGDVDVAAPDGGTLVLLHQDGLGNLHDLWDVADGSHLSPSSDLSRGSSRVLFVGDVDVLDLCKRHVASMLAFDHINFSTEHARV